MRSLMIFTITAFHLVYLYVASDKLSVSELDQEIESFLQLIEATTLWNEIKTNFSTNFSEGRFNVRH